MSLCLLQSIFHYSRAWREDRQLANSLLLHEVQLHCVTFSQQRCKLTHTDRTKTSGCQLTTHAVTVTVTPGSTCMASPASGHTLHREACGVRTHQYSYAWFIVVQEHKNYLLLTSFSYLFSPSLRTSSENNSTATSQWEVNQTVLHNMINNNTVCTGKPVSIYPLPIPPPPSTYIYILLFLLLYLPFLLLLLLPFLPLLPPSPLHRTVCCASTASTWFVWCLWEKNSRGHDRDTSSL